MVRPRAREPELTEEGIQPQRDPDLERKRNTDIEQVRWDHMLYLRPIRPIWLIQYILGYVYMYVI